MSEQESDITKKTVRAARYSFSPDPARKRLITVPNLISLGRMFLLIPLFYFLRQGVQGNGNFWALVIMAVALFTDIVDGWIARWFHIETDWGRVLDPIADKIWLGFLALFLAMPWREHPLPWEFLVLVILRDLGIIAGAYYGYRKTGEVMKSDMIGKIAMGFIALTLISYTIYWTPPFAPWLTPKNVLIFTAILLVASAINYAHRLRQVILHSASRAALERI
jgi:cardiolipin synthase